MGVANVCYHMRIPVAREKTWWHLLPKYHKFQAQGWILRRVVSAYDVVNASYLPTTINIYDLEIRSINNYRKSYDIASFLVSTKISRRCRFGNSKPCKYIRSSYVRRNCIYDNNRVSANIIADFSRKRPTFYDNHQALVK